MDSSKSWTNRHDPGEDKENKKKRKKTEQKEVAIQMRLKEWDL